MSFEGQYFHDAEGSKCLISSIRPVTNYGSFLELYIQYKVISLSTDTYTGICICIYIHIYIYIYIYIYMYVSASGIELITNFVGLAVITATINSNRGKVGHFSGESRDFAMTKEVSVWEWR